MHRPRRNIPRDTKGIKSRAYRLCDAINARIDQGVAVAHVENLVVAAGGGVQHADVVVVDLWTGIRRIIRIDSSGEHTIQQGDKVLQAI